MPPVGIATKLVVDLDMATRLAATIKTEALLEFEQRIRVPELLPEGDGAICPRHATSSRGNCSVGWRAWMANSHVPP